MCDIHHYVFLATVAAESQEPLISEVSERSFKYPGIIGGGVQCCKRLLTAGVCSSLSELYQTQKDAPRDRLLLGRELGERCVGLHGDRGSKPRFTPCTVGAYSRVKVELFISGERQYPTL